MSDIINKLKDDNEYYGGVGKNYLSNSDIGTLLNNPKDYGKEREDNREFLLGRYFHQCILEPHKAVNFPLIEVASRNAKAYKDFLEKHGLEVAMLLKEKEEVDEWIRTIKENETFSRYIYNPSNKYECPAVGEIEGAMWKGKADIVSEDFVYDIKTTSSIQDFKWNSRKYNYDSQAFIYQQLFGKPMIFLVIDKVSRMLGMYSVSDEALERGKEKVQRALRVYNKFYGDNATSDINQFYFYDEI